MCVCVNLVQTLKKLFFDLCYFNVHENKIKKHQWQQMFLVKFVSVLLSCSLAHGLAISGTLVISEKIFFSDLCDNTNIAATGGAGSAYLANWCAPNSNPCLWDGVTCDAAKTHVVSFALYGSIDQPTGTLPDSIGNFQFLQQVQMIQANISGTLNPQLFYNNADLFRVDIEHLPLDGSLPPLFSSGLQTLHVSFTKFHGTLPGSLGALPQLSELRLDHNKFNGTLPATLSGLPELITLDLRSNQFSGAIPDDICTPPHLEEINLRDNLFNKRAACFATIDPLQVTTCDLRNNKFCVESPAELNDVGPCLIEQTVLNKYDACGVCGGDGQSCRDCAGTLYGTLVLDACGVCGGSIPTPDLCPDCNGTPGGSLVYDLCGVCGGNGQSCRDCANAVYGSAIYDRCDVCNGDGQSCVDCCSTLYGTCVYDGCDICAGNGSSCKDCFGLSNGPNEYDICDVCGGNGMSCRDCLGVPFGSAAYDRCDVCEGDGSLCGIELAVVTSRGSAVAYAILILALLCLLTCCGGCIFWIVTNNKDDSEKKENLPAQSLLGRKKTPLRVRARKNK